MIIIVMPTLLAQDEVARRQPDELRRVLHYIIMLLLYNDNYSYADTTGPG